MLNANAAGTAFRFISLDLNWPGNYYFSDRHSAEILSGVHVVQLHTLRVESRNSFWI